ncbi:10716_t:CDS:2 [Diversispora eburnea]|uniref:10716_t:CDS:1 n=1 Tax=Diversispora eburnea TaxID=1213867 RepID=A0A9N8YM28_9GLOM|nr:10716_t:CDS:2 [Diversispora eburnea]
MRMYDGDNDYVVRPKRVENLGACIPETAAVLTCWSNNSPDSPSCQQIVQALTDCMRNAVSIL